MANYLIPIPSIKKWEGGLSKHAADNASANAVPDGSGYHTNKGITWATFIAMQSIVGYTATPELFYEMPESIWSGIFKKGYWDKVLGDTMRSQAVANLAAQIAWGSGAHRAGTSVQTVCNTLANGRGPSPTLVVDGAVGPKTLAQVNALTELDEMAFFNALYYHRLNYLKSLDDWAVFGNGWLNRYSEIYTFNVALISPSASSAGAAALVLLLTAAASIAAITYANNA